VVMQKHRYAWVAACTLAAMLGAAGVGLGAAARAAAARMVAVGAGKLCVTEGTVARGRGEEFLIDKPKMRAFVTEETGQSVEARFIYVGETAETAALGSGAVRHQFGLKLRAQDACNVVYAMWRFDPKNEVVVSVKSNPGMRESSQCGNRGYTNIKASWHLPVPEATKGVLHVLSARLNGQEMTVTADRKVVWEGSVGAGAMAFEGPVGMRSDNVRLNLELFAEEAGGGKGGAIPACKAYSE
jgi:hypothetical protein